MAGSPTPKFLSDIIADFQAVIQHGGTPSRIYVAEDIAAHLSEHWIKIDGVKYDLLIHKDLPAGEVLVTADILP